MEKENKPDNPPAFPFIELNRHTGKIEDQHYGMTLRDYFAAKAMQGMIVWHGSYGSGNGVESISKRAYEIADAMLKERNK